MLEYLMLATLSMPNIEYIDKECYVKTIVYDQQNSYVHMIGKCSYIYDKCIDDNCTIEKAPQKDLNFGRRKIG